MSQMHEHTKELKRALELIGDKWSALILLELTKGPGRFNELQATLGVNNTTLARRLETLTDAGLVTKKAFQEYPPRIEYGLTKKGRGLEPVLRSLAGWVREYLLHKDSRHVRS